MLVAKADDENDDRCKDDSEYASMCNVNHPMQKVWSYDMGVG